MGKLRNFFNLASETEGEFAKKMKLATGWERGTDGKWRYEESDMLDGVKASDIKDIGAYFLENGTHTTLGDLLGKEHSLFKSYPELLDLPVAYAGEDILGKNIGGGLAFINDKPVILIKEDNANTVGNLTNQITNIKYRIKKSEESLQTIGSDLWLENAKAFGIETDAQKAKESVKAEIAQMQKTLSDFENSREIAKEEKNKFAQNVLAHEIQHAIQRIEGFATGGNNSNNADYRRLAGEVEARNVQERLNYSDEQRRNSLASATEDVPRDEQAVRYGRGVMAYDDGGERMRVVGGNSGYVGYSMSKRAAQAREDGKFPKTDFKKEYGVTDKSLNALVDAGIINDKEWHHTSKFGNKTTFYEWDDDLYETIYANNKAEIDKASRTGDTATIKRLFDQNGEEYTRLEAEANAEKEARKIELEKKLEETQRIYEAKRKEREAKWNAIKDNFKGLKFREKYIDYESRYNELLNKKWVNYPVRVGNKLYFAVPEHFKDSTEMPPQEWVDAQYERLNGAEERFSVRGVSFEERQRKAVEDKGTVMPGLNEAEVKVVDVPKHHPFDISLRDADLKKQAKNLALENAWTGIVYVDNMPIRISLNSISEMADPKNYTKSISKDLHFAAMSRIKEIISNSIDAEIHPDYKEKDVNGKRVVGAYNKGVIMHRLYGAVNFEDKTYRVKTTVKEIKEGLEGKGYAYEVTNIELPENHKESAISNSAKSSNSIATAKLLQNVEKSYDKGKKLLDESKLADEARMSVRGGGGAQDDVRFRVIGRNDKDLTADDRKAIEQLSTGKWVKEYRAMQVIDGELYPPMAARVDGKMVDGVRGGEILKADENPDLVLITNKGSEYRAANGEKRWRGRGYHPVSEMIKGDDGKYYWKEAKPENEVLMDEKNPSEPAYKFKLDKGVKDATGKKATDIPARYNPYWHTSNSMLNDQFKSAWIRPNLVTVEVYIPKMEIDSGYKAQYAKDSVGKIDWKDGSVTGELVKQGHPGREVYLSRYCKIGDIVSESKVAEEIKNFIGDRDVVIPENVVTPKLRAELEKIGVKIGAPEKGVNKTEQIEEALADGLTVDNTVLKEAENARFSVKGGDKERSSERGRAQSQTATSSEGLNQTGTVRLSRNAVAQEDLAAKLKHNYYTAKKKLKNFADKGYKLVKGFNVVSDFVRELATSMGLRKEPTNRNSFYNDFAIETANGKFRLSNHPANGDLMSRGDFDQRISVFVYDKKGEHKNDGTKPWKEFVYYPDTMSEEEIARMEAEGDGLKIKTASQDEITKSVALMLDDMLEGRTAQDRSGKAEMKEYSSENEARMSVRGDGGGAPRRMAGETLDVWRSGMGLREKMSAAMNVLAGIIGKNNKDLTADDRKDISLKAINTRP